MGIYPEGAISHRTTDLAYRAFVYEIHLTPKGDFKYYRVGFWTNTIKREISESEVSSWIALDDIKEDLKWVDYNIEGVVKEKGKYYFMPKNIYLQQNKPYYSTKELSSRRKDIVNRYLDGY